MHFKTNHKPLCLIFDLILEAIKRSVGVHDDMCQEIVLSSTEGTRPSFPSDLGRFLLLLQEFVSLGVMVTVCVFNT